MAATVMTVVAVIPLGVEGTPKGGRGALVVDTDPAAALTAEAMVAARMAHRDSLHQGETALRMTPQQHTRSGRERRSRFPPFPNRPLACRDG